MLSTFHRTTSECWLRTPGTQKGSAFSSKGSRTKYKRQKERQNSQGWRPVLGRESRRRKSFQTAGNPLINGSVGSFGISQGNITGREKKKKKKKKNPQNTCLTTTPGEEVAQTLKRLPPASEQGLDREAWVDYLNRCRESL